MSRIEDICANLSGLAVIEASGALAEMPERPVVLSGSFNPLHRGHENLMAVASFISGRTPIYEISILNVDKPSISLNELRKRLAQFPPYALVAITALPRYIDKASLIPDACFAIGIDTAERLLDEKYYENLHSEKKKGSGMERALSEMRKFGCSFIIAGRIDENSSFRGLESLAIPTEFADMFTAIPASMFREDISSSVLRSKGIG